MPLRITILFTPYFILKITASVVVCILILLLLSRASLYAAGFEGMPKDTSLGAQKIRDSIPDQKEIMDVFKKWFRVKPTVKPDSARRDKMQIVVLPAIGYSLQTGVNVVASTNISFNLGKNKQTKLSSVFSVAQYSYQNKQFILPLISSLWTKNNKYHLLGDYRYLIYPTNTYGLGSSTSLSDASLINYNFVRFHQSVLRNLVSSLYLGGGYGLDLHYSQAEKLRPDLKVSDFSLYNGKATRTISSGFLVNLLFDGRKNSNNPAESVYTSIIYRPNFVFLGSDNNWQSLLVDFRKYIKMPTIKPSVLAFWSYNWFTFGGKVPYFDLPSTGWDKYSTMGRGYIQSRFRGSDLLYLEAEYRFTLTRNGLFGGVVFVNAESVTEIKSRKFENILPGTGLGIRIKANKASNVNLAIDYGFGAGGSRGFFVTVGEVF